MSGTVFDRVAQDEPRVDSGEWCARRLVRTDIDACDRAWAQIEGTYEVTVHTPLPQGCGSWASQSSVRGWLDGFRCRGGLGESEIQQLVSFLSSPPRISCGAANNGIQHAMWRISEQIS
jgi:hypothetical protein